MTAMNNPSVFLSYSHDSDAHKAWVRKLAEDLRHQGVDARLDQWDLRPGANLEFYMAEGIRCADRVLLVCSSTYVRKAEQRKGGAGYEGMIVTSHMARPMSGSTVKEKFIPLVRNNPGEARLPYFLRSLLWVDFRDDARYSERLEELLRELHDQRRFRKPPLGRPAFLPDPAEPGSQSQDSAGGASVDSRRFSRLSMPRGPVAAQSAVRLSTEPADGKTSPESPATAWPHDLRPHTFKLEADRVATARICSPNGCSCRGPPKTWETG
jgi:hypothetical protein